VASQKLLVDSLGVKRLVAVIGPSMGGFQSFQWAASYPGFMKGIAASVTAPRAPNRLGGLDALQKRLASDPNWNGGWYYENGGVPGILEQIRYETLLNYGQKEAEAKIAARSWAQIYDAHSLVTLRRAIDGFDITHQYDRLKQAKVLYVNSKTDKLFDIALCPAYVSDMRKAGVDVTYVELPSDKGHMASHADAAMWAPILAAFMKSL
jgi:homoserine O-acetyltransferase